MGPDIRTPDRSGACRWSGPACTVKVYPGDNLMVHKSARPRPAGRRRSSSTRAARTLTAVLGDLVSTKARHRGIAGFVVDGLIRDLPGIRALGDFPVFARGVTPIGPLHRGPGEINFPISAGGIVVQAGRHHRRRRERRRRRAARDRRRSCSSASLTQAASRGRLHRLRRARRLLERLGRPTARATRRQPSSAPVTRLRSLRPSSSAARPIAVAVARSLARSACRCHAVGDRAEPVHADSRHCPSFAECPARGRSATASSTGCERERPDGGGAPARAPTRRSSSSPATAPGSRRAGCRPIEADDEVDAARCSTRRPDLRAARARPACRAPRTVTRRHPRPRPRRRGRGFDYPLRAQAAATRTSSRSHYGISAKVFVAHDADELQRSSGRSRAARHRDARYRDRSRAATTPSVSYYSYLDAGGQPLFHLHQAQAAPVARSRSASRSFHVTDWEPEVARRRAALLPGRGPARPRQRASSSATRATASCKIIECNHRFTAASELVRLVGRRPAARSPTPRVAGPARSSRYAGTGSAFGCGTRSRTPQRTSPVPRRR